MLSDLLNNSGISLFQIPTSTVLCYNIKLLYIHICNNNKDIGTLPEFNTKSITDCVLHYQHLQNLFFVLFIGRSPYTLLWNHPNADKPLAITMYLTMFLCEQNVLLQIMPQEVSQLIPINRKISCW